MANRFESTNLWQRTLATQLDPDPDAELRGELRAAFGAFRGRAEQLASEIARDLPDFTTHDITHVDALWEMAQLVAGPDYPLTPTEAFVLGGAFLVHDLGLSVAAIPDGVSALREEPLYRDSVAAQLRKRLGRAPTAAEQASADEEVRRVATGNTLRALHARYAERLALAVWKDDRWNEYHLIEHPELRKTYGTVIGIIAHSHWWASDRLVSDLPAPLGAPGGYPNDWIVDPLKLACLLRVADACHLDSRRAPLFIRALRRPKGDAVAHWDFQEKLYQPRLEAGRLVFTSKEPFSVTEAQAWWTCFDALQVVDRELRDVDLELANSRRPRLAARSVTYVEEPRRLARLIPTAGWHPVDTQVRVSAVASLVRSLGGEALYGKNYLAPVRELIQNGTDAVRARRVLEGLGADWGKVVVRAYEDVCGSWIEVEDNGVGMSTAVLSGPLLDFGSSFWGSPLMHAELPGLEAAGFSAIGRFGIGFFSVFMLGDHIAIFSRRFEAARDDTWVLQFDCGLTARPLLRKARPDEVMRDGGTRIRIKLQQQDILRDHRSVDRQANISDLLKALCPTLDVNLYLEEDGGPVQRLITALDWITIPGAELLRRINPEAESGILTNVVTKFGPLLEVIRSEAGEPVGRACIMPSGFLGAGWTHSFGIVTVGGFAAPRLTGIAGVLTGEATRASRESALPVVSGAVLSDFASRQARVLPSVITGEDCIEALLGCASVVRALGGECGPLPIALSCDGALSYDDIVVRFRLLDVAEVVIVQDAAVSLEKKRNGNFELLSNVLVASVGRKTFVQPENIEEFTWWPPETPAPLEFDSRTIKGLCIEALCSAWNAAIVDVLAISERSRDEMRVSAIIGRRGDGSAINMRADVIRRPR